MIKRLLLCVTMLASLGSVSAQEAVVLNPQQVENVSSLMEKSANLKVGDMGLAGASQHPLGIAQMPSQLRSMKKPAPMRRAGEDNTIWFAYPMSEDGKFSAIGWKIISVIFDDKASAYAQLTNYNVAFMVPGNYAKAVVDSVIMVLGVGKYTNVKLWIDGVKSNAQGSISFPQTPDMADYHENLADFELKGAGRNMFALKDLELASKYTIPENGCLIGFSFTTTTESPLVFWGEPMSGGFFFGVPAQNQDVFLDMSLLKLGSLVAMARLDVTNCSHANVSMDKQLEKPALINQETRLSAAVHNNAASAIDNVSFVLTVDGEAQKEQTYNFPAPLAGGGNDELVVPYTFTTEGVHQVEFKITKVNGEVNTSSNPSTSYEVFAFEKSAKRTSVVEEFTGTWCVWCPRGHVGVHKLKERYGDDIIILAGHASRDEKDVDPMGCASYYDVIRAYNPDFPIALYDRSAFGDPYADPASSTLTFGSYKYVEFVKEIMPTEATVALTADWADTGKSVINAKVDFSFGCSRISLGSANPYAIAFVLSEDGMQGEKDDHTWYQANGFSGGTGYNADFGSWTSAGRYVNMAYDNVIVQAWDALNGIDESVPSVVMKDEKLSYSTTLDISANTLIQNKEKLYLTALLLNRNNYSIVNAAQVSLGNGGSASIEGVTDDANGATVVARYNVNGVRLDKDQKGLNIVKYSDGTTKKVMVK